MPGRHNALPFKLQSHASHRVQFLYSKSPGVVPIHPLPWNKDGWWRMDGTGIKNYRKPWTNQGLWGNSAFYCSGSVGNGGGEYFISRLCLNMKNDPYSLSIKLLVYPSIVSLNNISLNNCESLLVLFLPEKKNWKEQDITYWTQGSS